MGRTAGGTNARITVPMVLRMRQLRAAGLSAEAIGRVLKVDFGEQPCEATIRHYTATPEKRAFTRAGIVGLTTGSKP